MPIEQLVSNKNYLINLKEHNFSLDNKSRFYADIELQNGQTFMTIFQSLSKTKSNLFF